MKKLLVIILLAGSYSWAGGMSEISWMAEEDSLLALTHRGVSFSGYSLVKQAFVKVDGADLAIETTLQVADVSGRQTQEWTCVSQFVKTPSFFKVSKTVCLN